MASVLDNRQFYNRIGQRLKLMRRKNGYTLTHMGNVLSISYQQYQKYEGGKSRPPLDKIYRLKHFYDIPYDDFFDGV